MTFVENDDVIQEFSAKATSIALTSDDKPYIVYQDARTKVLMFSQRAQFIIPGTIDVWSKTQLDSSVGTGAYPSIVVRENNKITVANS